MDSCDTEAKPSGYVGDSPLDSIEKLLMLEVRKYARAIKSGRRCILCPFRSFSAPYRLREHVQLYHTKESNWSASGRKQLGICVALYDFDQLSKNKIPPDGVMYPQRSAAIIREDIEKVGLSASEEDELSRSNLVDRYIRLAQYADGPRIFRSADLQNRRVHIRRVGYGNYSSCFYNSVAKACMLRECRIERVVAHMVGLCKNQLASLLPKFNHVWDSVTVGIFSPPI